MNNSPASSGSSFQLQNSPDSSGQDIQEQRKRKRMISNRESARRSRLRKKNHFDEMMTQVSQLRNDNNQVLENINMVTRLYENVEAENCVLKAQTVELTNRLESLNEIIMNCMKFGGDHGDMIGGCGSGALLFDHHYHHHEIVDCADDFIGPWNLINNQQIMASADLIMY